LEDDCGQPIHPASLASCSWIDYGFRRLTLSKPKSFRVNRTNERSRAGEMSQAAAAKKRQ